MGFFRRTEITVRRACRGTTLAVPTRDALLDACQPGLRRRLQLALARHSADAPVWSVHWAKIAGEWLHPNDVAVRLRIEEVVVELVYGQRAKLAETLAAGGTRVACGETIARLERRAKAPASSQTQLLQTISQFTARQRQDAEMITALQHDLAAQQLLVARLRHEVASLEGHRAPSGGAAGSDAKFRRLKHEFSKRYHPDARPTEDAERAQRARVFQEFWPVVEEIDRS
jgi:hypothetical protein